MKGFTLIELLVVVLIIGILAAVALPQYEKAVAKTRFTEAKINLSALRKAEEIYFLENGNYTSDLSLLDLALACPKEGENYKCSNFTFFVLYSESSQFGVVAQANIGFSNPWWVALRWEPVAGRWHCEAMDGAKGETLCLELGSPIQTVKQNGRVHHYFTEVNL